ncbi:MAG: hypothetical protein V4702_00895 [Patescibacteria group bacterium]
MSSAYRKITKIAALILLLAAPLVIWTQRWNIYDFWRLRDYEPPAAIAQLATDTTLNDRARRLFYVYHPELKDKSTFSDSCNSSERTIVLGCYVSGAGIYLFDVTDQRLNGIVQVTAAHETLHAAYDRLSGSEKQRINKLVDEAFAKVSSQRIRDTVEDYRKNGADIANELHSIMGTEVRELPPELEDYYKQFFTSRLKVVEYSEKYEKAFTERKQKIEAYDAQLDSIKKQIENLEAELNDRENDIQAERSRLDGLLNVKDFERYNAGVNGFNAQVNAYNGVVGRIRALIDQHNRLVAERNAIAEEEGELVKAIDSRPATIPPQ